MVRYYCCKSCVFSPLSSRVPLNENLPVIALTNWVWQNSSMPDLGLTFQGIGSFCLGTLGSCNVTVWQPGGRDGMGNCIQTVDRGPAQHSAEVWGLYEMPSCIFLTRVTASWTLCTTPVHLIWSCEILTHKILKCSKIVLP